MVIVSASTTATSDEAPIIAPAVHLLPRLTATERRRLAEQLAATPADKRAAVLLAAAETRPITLAPEARR